MEDTVERENDFITAANNIMAGFAAVCPYDGFFRFVFSFRAVVD
jgi:hypothetical protein